ncbi:MAG: putative hydrolase, CocE/NonD family [Rhizobium sp.]|nr:putative hydrolase, CocE/NonD family [Rhizobium sp.]
MTQHESIAEQFGGETIEVLYSRSLPLDAPKQFPLAGAGFYPPLNPRSYIEDEIRVDQDVAVRLRDGTTIYVDIYRPAKGADSDALPAILSWCWYGKRPGDESDEEWATFGVVPGTHSQMVKFEGPDPGFWCKKGYAVVNADPRGAGNSEGRLVLWGKQDGEDGHDAIEWIAEQPWSNGKVGMFGNSGLAMCQWFIAAEQPPHLACIAPWEGTSDMYREFVSENGIPGPGFMSFVASIGRSASGLMEDYNAMLRKYPLMNAYWQSKVPEFANITVPAYVTGGWSHVHMMGSINGYRWISSEKKWLRVHRDFEWPDTYSWWNMEDLERFFDRYLKGIRNGWEMTPRVRLDIMDAYDFDSQVHRPETDFPLDRTVYTRLYLGGENSLASEPSSVETSLSYDPETEEANFDIKFTEDTELAGFIKAHLWVEADGHDEMDLFLTVQKLDQGGEWLPTSVFGLAHPGAWARARVSHRALDEDLSTDFQPVQSHRVEQRLSPGEIVAVDVAFYPHARIWHAGETLRLRVAGRYIRKDWFEPFSYETDNKGRHVLHAGGQYDSYLQIPVIPPKHRSGAYVYR